MARIFATHPLPGPAFEALCQEHQVEIFQGDEAPTPEQLQEGVKDAHVLICLLRDNVDKAVIKAGKKLEVIANYAVGTDNVNVVWATMRDILVLNTPYVLTDATAEHAFALMLAVARRIGEGDRMVRDGHWQGWQPTQLLGTQVTGKTLGIIGMGHIGRAMAQRARGFNMEILYHNRHRAPIGAERELGVTYCSLEELLAQSDFLSLHCPLTPETRHLIDASRIAMMKPGAILINTARGPVVDEQALIDGLTSGHLAGAGLDVFEAEPDVPEALRTMPQVILAPHTGSATVETRAAMTDTLLRGVQRYLNNRRPNNVVNVEVLPAT